MLFLFYCFCSNSILFCMFFIWNNRTMRYLLLITLVSGCSIINIAPYDPGEYALINDLRTTTQQQQHCSQLDLQQLTAASTRLQNYSQYLPNNQPTITAVQNINNIIKELVISNNPSETYCKLKLNLIEKNLESLQQTVGNKPR